MKRIVAFSYVLLFLVINTFSQVLDQDTEKPETIETDDRDEIRTVFGKDRKNGFYFDLYFN